MLLGVVITLAALVCVSPAFAQAPVPVTTAQARRTDFPVYLRGLGQAHASASVLVRARVDGALMQVAVTEGQTVTQGELIAVIDPRPFKAALDQAEARRASDQALLTNAQLDLARTASLATKDFASRQKVDNQQALVSQYVAALAGADAAVEAAKLNLGFCYITAPIPGRVGLRLIDPGNMIRASDGAAIVAINQVQPIAAIFTLPQDALPRIQAAMAAQASALPAFAYASNDKTRLAQGSLLTPDNAIDPATGTIKMKVIFANPDNSLWPGQFVHIRLLVETLVNVLTVPVQAIQHGPGGLYVYVTKPDATVARVPVEVTIEDAVLAVVAKGLGDGAVVVTGGQSRLQAGTRVSATEMTTEPPGPKGSAPAKPAGSGS